MRIHQLAVAIAGVAMALNPAPAQQPTHSPSNEASEALTTILDEHVQWRLAQSPLMASGRGDLRYNDQLSDASPEATKARNRVIADRLAQLSDFLEASADDLSPRELVDANLLARELRLAIAASAFHPEQTPINAISGPQIWLPQMGDRLPFTTPKHYDDYATRLELVPALLAQYEEQLRLGMAAGRLPPRIAVASSADQALAQATSTIRLDPATSPFYKPMRALDPDSPTAQRAQRAIAQGIVPAFERFGTFLRDEYTPACRNSIGASQSVDGIAWYNHQLRVHTTTDLTAEQIHTIGLDEVARLDAEMLATIARTDFANPDGLTGRALFAAFADALRTDPRFYYDTPDALLDRYRVICKTTDPELARLFGILPRLPYGVRPMDPLQAPTSPTAYYYHGSIETGVPGYFVANTYRLDQRPKYEMIALTLHESVPGHHLQIARAQELTGMHMYRTMVSSSAFTEGWALYAERLGLEMGDHPLASGGHGLYEDPYDDFGRLNMEIWRALRLVVDTGIHARGWSRQRAIDYMTAHSALAPLNIEREVDRYIGWPGQACAYKLGELKIRALRARAESLLGDRFDLRAFHDELLGQGSIPLGVLDTHMNRWLVEQIFQTDAQTPARSNRP